MASESSINSIELSEEIQKLWGQSLIPAGCAACKQSHLIQESLIGKTCPNCGKALLSPQPSVLRSEPPELIIPFSISIEQIKNSLIEFTKDVWLRNDDFNHQSMMQRITPVYWPMWLVDSNLKGIWRAEVGFDYQVKSSQEFFENGNWRTREVVENRIRWEKRIGQVTRGYDNITVPALSDYQERFCLIGDFQLSKSSPYKSTYFGKSGVLIPDFLPENAWSIAQDQLNRVASLECLQATKAQHIRDFAVQAQYDCIHWTQLLLPVYVTYYADDSGTSQMVYINGQTGQIGGFRFASQRKGWKWAGILFAFAVFSLILGIIGTALATLFVPLGIIGMLFFVLAFMLGLAAIIPAVWPWQWNRKQQNYKISNN